MSTGFTLIELLIALAIVAILSVVVITAINPNQLLKQSRDSGRISDLATLNKALSLYSVAVGDSLGTASTVYVSIPDSSVSCANLGLPALPSGWSYHCAPQASYRKVDGTGWLPLNFSQISFGSPLSILPADPTNTTSTGLYYTYTAGSGNRYEIAATLESAKYKLGGGADKVSTDAGSYPDLYETGTKLTLLPTDYGDSSLVGYWKFDEGSGSTAYDASGKGNNGTWNGTQAGTSGYYSAGKVGPYAGYFDGSTDFVNVLNSSSVAITGSIAIATWFISGLATTTPQAFVSRWGSSNSYVLDWNHGSVSQKLGFFTAGPGTISTSTTAGDNNWHQAVAIYNGSALNLYLDGALVHNQAGSGSISDNSGNLRIGKDGTGLGPAFFNGLIDDIRIYNRALSAAEIQAIYNATK